MTSKQMKLVESAVGKIYRRVANEAYRDDEDTLENVIAFTENDHRLYDILMKTYLPALQKFAQYFLDYLIDEGFLEGVK